MEYMKLREGNIYAPNQAPELRKFATWFKNDIIMAEIGSYAGGSADIFLQSGKVRTLFCIDPWKNGYDKNDAASESCDMSIVEAEFDRTLSKYNNFVKVKQTSEEAAKMFPNNFFDLIYIDGDHQKEAVKNDVALWLPKIKPDGWISGHDFHFSDVQEALMESFGYMPNAGFEDTSWVYFPRPHRLL